MRATRTFSLVLLLSSCHGPPVGDPVQGAGGASGQGGGSGAVGTGGAGTGTGGSSAGTGGSGAGTGGSGGSGAGGSGGANACARCETPCTDGVCELALLRKGQGGEQLGPTSVALDGTTLYFAVGPGVEVRSMPKQGGQETILYPNQTCSGCVLTLAVDDSEVFFASENIAGTPAILAKHKDNSGSVRTVSTTDALPGQLTLEGPDIYWYRQDTGVQRCPKTGGGSTPVAPATGVVLRMASRPGSVVWGNRDTGVVTRVDTDTLAQHVLGVTVYQQVFYGGVGDIVEDGTLAYWVLNTWPNIVYVEGTGNSPMELGRSLANSGSSDQTGSIGVDGPYVYFTESGLLDRVPKVGGTVEARAFVRTDTRQEFRGRIVGFDATYVYIQQTGAVQAALFRVVK